MRPFRRCSGWILLPLLTVVTACSDSGSSSSSQVDYSQVELSFSDAAVDNASAVVITVDRITFRGNGEDIVVDDFLNEETGVNDASTFTIDLMQVQGTDRRLVVDSVELPVGEYSNMLIDVLDNDSSLSYVTDAQGNKELMVPSDQLKLGGFSINPLSKQSMVVEFGLSQSMTYNPGPDRYILKPRGVRIVSVDEAAALEGTIDHALLQESTVCAANDSGGTHGSLYLYAGHNLQTDLLADNFIVEEGEEQPDRTAPIASSNLNTNDFILSYLEPGDYTLSLSCHGDEDTASVLEGFDIPNPEDQLIEVSLEAGQTLQCTVPLSPQACTSDPQVQQPATE